MDDSELRPHDRYSVARYLLDNANLVIKYAPESGNLVTDLADRNIKELTKLGVSRRILTEAICIFYRDFPSVLEQLDTSNRGRDYLAGLEIWMKKK